MKFVAEQTASKVDRTADSSQPNVVAGTHKSCGVPDNIDVCPSLWLRPCTAREIEQRLIAFISSSETQLQFSAATSKAERAVVSRQGYLTSRNRPKFCLKTQLAVRRCRCTSSRSGFIYPANRVLQTDFVLCVYLPRSSFTRT